MKPLIIFMSIALMAAPACNIKSKKDAGIMEDSGTQKLKSAKNEPRKVPGQYVVFLSNSIARPIMELEQPHIKDRKNKKNYFEPRRKKYVELIKKFAKNYSIGEENIKRYYTDVAVGFCAKLNESQVSALKSDLHIEGVYQDSELELMQVGEVQPVPESELGPYFVSKGVDMMGGPRPIATRVDGINYLGNFENVLWILDTGVDTAHPDLNFDTSAADFLTSTGTSFSIWIAKGVAISLTDSSVNDNHGHGTMVAGIISAYYNEFGITGVAPNCLFIPVKITETLSTGQVGAEISTLIEGLDYVLGHSQHGDVVFIGLGSYPTSDCFRDGYYLQTLEEWLFYSIAAMSQANFIKFALPAGNEGDCSGTEFTLPACITGHNIFVVGALDEDFSCAAYSNWGASAGWGACGTYASTYLNGTYAVGSGTSFAAAAVAGLLLSKSAPPFSSRNLACCNLSYGAAHYSRLSVARFDLDIELAGFNISNVRDGDGNEDVYGKMEVSGISSLGSQLASNLVFWEKSKEEAIHVRNSFQVDINNRITVATDLTYDQLRHLQITLNGELYDEEGLFDPRIFHCQECDVTQGNPPPPRQKISMDFFRMPSTLLSISDLLESFYTTLKFKGQQFYELNYYESNNQNDGWIKVKWKVYVKPKYSPDPNCSTSCHGNV